jgi:hypothetical protein
LSQLNAAERRHQEEVGNSEEADEALLLRVATAESQLLSNQEELDRALRDLHDEKESSRQMRIRLLAAETDTANLRSTLENLTETHEIDANRNWDLTVQISDLHREHSAQIGDLQRQLNSANEELAQLRRANERSEEIEMQLTAARIEQDRNRAALGVGDAQRAALESQVSKMGSDLVSIRGELLGPGIQ